MDEVGSYTFSAALWRYPGDSAWHFVSVPSDISADIDDLTAGARRGFGSVRVEATVGSSTWRTSVFPDTKAKTYLLPMKKPVRLAERLEAGDDVAVHLDIIDL